MTVLVRCENQFDRHMAVRGACTLGGLATLSVRSGLFGYVGSGRAVSAHSGPRGKARRPGKFPSCAHSTNHRISVAELRNSRGGACHGLVTASAIGACTGLPAQLRRKHCRAHAVGVTGPLCRECHGYTRPSGKVVAHVFADVFRSSRCQCRSLATGLRKPKSASIT